MFQHRSRQWTYYKLAEGEPSVGIFILLAEWKLKGIKLSLSHIWTAEVSNYWDKLLVIRTFTTITHSEYQVYCLRLNQDHIHFEFKDI